MIKKFPQARQYLPKLNVDNATVSPVELNYSFTYLGRHYNFNMDEIKQKEALSEKLNELLDAIDRLLLHPKN